LDCGEQGVEAAKRAGGDGHADDGEVRPRGDRARAYAAVEAIHFPGMQYRTDIALEAMELEDF
ncbi:MAG TPA: hypothetical protein VHM69_05030, partial [Rubrobacter sp.]|nr:hypothetical protein [Rubrobacter sp.]